MDQVKIGKYIAGKRKALGYTQVQLAEKLGMSDKSVSKWERGVCLPDVSVYTNLCEILGISLNEFFAGEDIEEEKVVEKSEENLIEVAWAGKKKSRHLQKVIIVFIVIVVLLVGLFVSFLNSEGYFLRNYVKAYPADSVERATAQMLTGTEGAFLYEYSVDDKFERVTIEMTTYHRGEKEGEPIDVEFGFAEDEKREGILTVVPKFAEGKISLIVTGEMSKMSTEIEIDNSKTVEEYYACANTEISEKLEVQKGKPEGVLALFYDEGHMQVPMIENIAEDNGDALQHDDICYYFTVTFE